MIGKSFSHAFVTFKRKVCPGGDIGTPCERISATAAAAAVAILLVDDTTKAVSKGYYKNVKIY